jgi:secretion/DNA translocation related TadE-like protein
MRRSEPDAERGSATLLAVAIIGILLLLGMAANLVVAAAAAHRAAQAAADLAALAGAQAWQVQRDATQACAAAATVAHDNRAGMTVCRVEGDDVLTVVQVDGPSLFGQTFEITGRARAGPETTDSGAQPD